MAAIPLLKRGLSTLRKKGESGDQKYQIEKSDETMGFLNYNFSWYTVLNLKDLKPIFLYIVRVP